MFNVADYLILYEWIGNNHHNRKGKIEKTAAGDIRISCLFSIECLLVVVLRLIVFCNQEK